MNNISALSALLLLSSLCWSQDSPKITPAYWSAVAFTGIGIGLDAYTTAVDIHPRPHQFACTVEVGSPELYGRHPHAARVSAVMGAEFASASILAYELKKHIRGKFLGKLWLLPLAGEADGHWQGAIHNFQHCP